MGYRSRKLNSVGKSLILFIIVFLVFIFNVYSQTIILDKTEKKIYKKAVKLLNQGKTNEALTSFLNVYASNPTNIDNLYQITGIYYDELEDYGNAYKYGKQLLEIAKEALPKVYSDKEKIKINNIIGEMQLLVEITKDKLGIEDEENKNENENQPAVTEFENKSETVESSDNLVNEPVVNFTETNSNESEKTTNFNSTINDSLNTISTEYNEEVGFDLFAGFIPYNHFSSNDYKYLERVYDSLKDAKSFWLKGFSGLYSKNNSIKEFFINDFINYLNTIRETEKELISLIYNYNIYQHAKDSSEKYLYYLMQRNQTLKSEIINIKGLINDIEHRKDSNIINNLSANPKVYLGKYLIKESVDNEKVLELLSVISNRIKKNNDFENPIVGEFLTFIVSDNENKYLILAVQISNSIYDKKSFHGNVEELSSLVVYDLAKDSLININNKKKIAISDFGLKPNELKTLNSFINSLNKINSRKIAKSSQFTDSLINMQNKLLLLERELSANEFIIGGTVRNYDSIIEKYLFEFNNVRNNYEFLIKEIKTYSNYLEVRKEIETKTSLEQFKDMAKIITNLFNRNLNDVKFKISRIQPVMDTVNFIPHISAHITQQLLKPDKINVKVLSLAKIKDPASQSNYLGLSLGFEVNYINEQQEEGIVDVKSENSTFNVVDIKPKEIKETKISSSDETVSPNTTTVSYFENPADTKLKEEGAFSIVNERGMIYIKDENGKKWKAIDDNPGSFISYTMFNEEEGWRLPTFDELKNLMEYLSSHLEMMNNVGWPHNGEVYLSSDNHLDNRNNRLYKSIKISGNSLKETEVQSGGEVWIILISE